MKNEVKHNFEIVNIIKFDKTMNVHSSGNILKTKNFPIEFKII